MEIAIKSLQEHKITRVDDCVTLLKHCLAGLTYLHGKKIIHRDIKPANILLTSPDPVWKLSDFGLSKVADVTTTFCGSPIYLAPEIGGLAYSAYTTAVDIWALGIVGLEYTCGISPGILKLLQDKTNREPYNDAVIRQIPRSPLAQYLRLMLEPVASKRVLAGKMGEMLESWVYQGAEVLVHDSQHEERPSARTPLLRATIP
jgi:serine/threonine protein kinase